MTPGLVRFLALVIAAATPLGAAVAQAQSPAENAPDQRRVGSWTMAGGINTSQINLGTSRPGTRVELFGSLGRYWNLSSHVDLRVQAIGGMQRPRALTLNAANGCDGCEVWTARQFAGLYTTLNREWRQGAAFRPYVLAGGGFMLVHSMQRPEGECFVTASCEMVVDPGTEKRRYTQGQLTYALGTGASFRLGKADLFAEYSWYGMRRTSTPLAPISIGLRF